MKTKDIIITDAPALVWTETVTEGLTDRQILNRLKKLQDAEQRKKDAEREIEALRAEIIGDAERLDINADAFAVKYTLVTSARIDSKRLKEERPDIYAEYTKEITSARFTYKIK